MFVSRTSSIWTTNVSAPQPRSARFTEYGATARFNTQEFKAFVQRNSCTVLWVDAENGGCFPINVAAISELLIGGGEDVSDYFCGLGHIS